MCGHQDQESWKRLGEGRRCEAECAEEDTPTVWTTSSEKKAEQAARRMQAGVSRGSLQEIQSAAYDVLRYIPNRVKTWYVGVRRGAGTEFVAGVASHVVAEEWSTDWSVGLGGDGGYAYGVAQYTGVVYMAGESAETEIMSSR